MKRKARHVMVPASFRTNSPSYTKTSIAIGISTAMLAPVSTIADEAAKETEMATVTVVERVIDHNPYAEPDAPYKARISGDERRKRPLAETPATINVLTKTQIEDSGYTDLRDILDTQPGITLGTGENGNAFGDRYIIRGQEARSDVFVDGLRDPGMSIRESFAVEQVEVSKGPSSSFAGRGTAGGAINSITKQATTDYDFTKLSVGLGTDDHQRFTLDTNYALSDTVALRANLLYSYEEVPDRNPADRERKGVALSGLFKPSENLNVLLDYYGFRGNDRPDMGTYLYGTVPNRKPFENPPVYAQDGDFLKSHVDTLTARLNYRFNDNVRLTNATRWGKSENGYVVTGAGYVSDSALRLTTHQGWQEVDYFANQTNLFVDAQIAGMKHEWNFGLEYTDHAVLNGIYSINGVTATNQPTAPNVPFSGVQGAIDHSNISKFNWDQDWRAKTVSLSVMDTVDLSDKWTAFAGVRYDHTKLSLKTQTPATSVITGDYSYSDSMWNGHVGVTYKFLPYANVYLTYASAKDINGGESDVGTSGGYGGLITFNGSAAGAKPETTQNLELGTKWDLMGGKLLATAALFHIKKSDVMEANGYSSTGTFNSAANLVRGVEFGLAGNLTDKLSAFAGVTFMNAKVTKSATASKIGKTLSNFADTSASAQLRYQATPAFAFGTAVKYESEKYAGEPDTAASYDANGVYNQPIPAYTVWDLFADYRLNKAAKLRLNIGNVLDKDYYLAGYRSGSFVYKGDARNARLTLNYDF
ncbi:MAG: TonB-dependent siderophore receptor [Dechloromonas sp.]|nr:TonB-dependent siderophore receptor [Dechloromonas sp.]